MRAITIATITALTLSTTGATAGGLPEAVMEPDVIQEATASSSAGVIVPLLLLLLVALAVGGSGGGGGSAPVPPVKL